MRTVGAYEAKTKLGELLDAAEHGETVVVTRRGVPVARLEPYGGARPRGAAIDHWLAIRSCVKPLGMTMKEAVEYGRKR